VSVIELVKKKQSRQSKRLRERELTHVVMCDLLSGFEFVGFGDAAALRSKFEAARNRGAQYAAFLMEPIQGEGGTYLHALAIRMRPLIALSLSLTSCDGPPHAHTHAGIVVPLVGCLRAARELCTEFGVLLIANEMKRAPPSGPSLP
jgi:4-aminobutyrate aminotransferase-like enzyme